MIDAVNKVLGEQPVVQPTQPVQPTQSKETLLREGWDDMVKSAKDTLKDKKQDGGSGMKQGSRYGGSKQKDEKEPVKEELKGDQHKIDKNKNKKIDAEDFKILRKEELKGNQDEIDANKNNKIDGGDFKILRAKKKMREHLNDMPFAKRLVERELDEGIKDLAKKAFKVVTGGSDEDQRKDLQKKMGIPQTGKIGMAKKNEEVELDETSQAYRDAQAKQRSAGIQNRADAAEDKMKKKADEPKSAMKYAAKTFMSHAKNPLGLKKEEVVSEEIITLNIDPHTNEIKDLPQFLSSDLNEDSLMMLEEDVDVMINEVLSKDASAGAWIHDFVHSKNPKFAGKSKAERKRMALGAYYGKQNEAVDSEITTDKLDGRQAGGNSNSFTSFKKKLKGDVAATPPGQEAKPTAATKTHTPEPTADNQKIDNLDNKYGKPNAFKEEKEQPPFDGPYKKSSKDVKDKSGAAHTPMSRAKHLASQALKSVKDKTKIK